MSDSQIGSNPGWADRLPAGRVVENTSSRGGPTPIAACSVFSFVCGWAVLSPIFIAITSLAPTIIGALGAAGVLSGTTVSATLIATSSFTFLASCIHGIGGEKMEKIVALVAALVSLAFMTIGGLGTTGILSEVTVGWVSIGNFLFVYGGAIYYDILKTERAKRF